MLIKCSDLKKGVNLPSHVYGPLDLDKLVENWSIAAGSLDAKSPTTVVLDPENGDSRPHFLWFPATTKMENDAFEAVFRALRSVNPQASAISALDLQKNLSQLGWFYCRESMIA